MKHETTVGPSVAKLVDANGKVTELPKTRSQTHRARCSCGWVSQEYASAKEADTAGLAHLRLMTKLA